MSLSEVRKVKQSVFMIFLRLLSDASKQWVQINEDTRFWLNLRIKEA